MSKMIWMMKGMLVIFCFILNVTIIVMLDETENDQHPYHKPLHDSYHNQHHHHRYYHYDIPDNRSNNHYDNQEYDKNNQDLMSKRMKIVMEDTGE